MSEAMTVRTRWSGCCFQCETKEIFRDWEEQERWLKEHWNLGHWAVGGTTPIRRTRGGP
jgi:hypothetical protein